jgi:RND superfamily putative drug exporter
MAKYLYRLGGWSFQHRRRVVIAWVAVVAVVIACAAAFSGNTNNSFTVPGTESQQAQDLLEERFPGASGTSARVVYKAPEGESLLDAQNKEAVMASVAQASEAEDVSAVIDPYSAQTITKDGSIAFADVIYPDPASEISESAKDELAEIAAPAEAAGLRVEFGGGLVAEEKAQSSESAGLLIGFMVLAITLGSLLAAGLPLVTAIVGVILGVTGLTALSGVIDVSETAPILATMLGLAVGIDYALFILSRHRQNMDDGLPAKEAAAQATATAGSAVVFAGATVVIALVGLTVVNIPFLTVMGLAAAGTVAIAVIIALTLLPALLGFAGNRVTRLNRVLGLRPGAKRADARRSERGTMSRRYVEFITRRPWKVLVVGLVLLSVCAIPATHLKLGLPDGGSKPADTTERRAYDLLTEGFGPGFNGTLTIVVDAPGLDATEQNRIAGQLALALQGEPGIAAVSKPAQNEQKDLTIVQVTPVDGPTSDSTKDLVSLLRDKAAAIPESSGVNAYVTGTTALNIDTADALSDALPRYIAVVVGLALVLLMVAFRSILIPLKAAAGFLLSVAASMGVVVWVFQDGNLADVFSVANPSPILSFLPVLLIGILFGLAMDYEVFLVSRMREAFVRSGNPREAVVEGYARSGRVVIAAAIIMIGVFGAFVLDPDPITKSIGVSLAFGVLADAFIVRLTLVPAVMTLLGRRAWQLPRRMERIVPNMDIEGEKLSESLGGHDSIGGRAPSHA